MQYLEVTTVIGCPGACYQYCPQEVFLKRYGKRLRFLTLDNWHKVLHNIPSDLPIRFGDFSEPLLSRNFIQIAKMALNHGHKLNLFTTLYGSSNNQIAELLTLNFEHDCGLVLHLPDGKVMQAPKDPDYANKLFKVVTNPNFSKVDTVRMDDNFVTSKRENILRGTAKPTGGIACRANVFRIFKPSLLPDGVVYPCCFSGDTIVVCRIKMKRFFNERILLTTFNYLNYLTLSNSIESLHVPYKGCWQKARLVATHSGSFYKITLKNGVIINATKNHLFLTRDNKKVEALKTTIDLKSGDYLPFSLTGYETAEDKGGSFDLGRFLGLYLAEGTRNEYLYFGDSENEVNLANFAVNFAKTYFCGNSRVVSVPKRHTTIAYISTTPSHVAFISMFIKGKGSHNKQLAQLTFRMSKKFRKGLIQGIFEGDGHTKKSATLLTLANPILLQQISYLLASIGIPYSIGKTYKTKTNSDCGELYITKKPPENAKFGRYRFPFWDAKNQEAWCAIDTVVPERNQNKHINAFCFEILEGEPYFQLANGFIVHNCMDMALLYPMGNLIVEDWETVTNRIRHQKRLSICAYCTWSLTRKQYIARGLKKLAKRILCWKTEEEY